MTIPDFILARQGDGVHSRILADLAVVLTQLGETEPEEIFERSTKRGRARKGVGYSERRAAVYVALRSFVLHGEPRYSFPEIAKACGQRGHSTVVDAVRRHEAKRRQEVASG